MSAAAPMMGPPPGAPAQIQVGGPSPAPGGGGDVEKLLMIAKAALQQAEQVESDHIDMATINKCIVAIQSLLADRQKQSEAALGVQPAHKAMARAY